MKKKQTEKIVGLRCLKCGDVLSHVVHEDDPALEGIAVRSEAEATRRHVEVCGGEIKQFEDERPARPSKYRIVRTA